MFNTINIHTGDLFVCRGDWRLVASGIGSCIAVAVMDSRYEAGGLAHVMLPGCAPRDSVKKTRYARDCIEGLCLQMERELCRVPVLNAVLAGAGNVLEMADDVVCQQNIDSVRKILADRGISIVAESLGGTSRRRISFDVSSGRVFCAEGDENESLMWSFRTGISLVSGRVPDELP